MLTDWRRRRKCAVGFENRAVDRLLQSSASTTPSPVMPVNLQAPDPATLFAVAGVRIGTAMAGVRKANRRDLVVFALDEGSSVAGVFTLNRFCAAPVQVCREHLAAGHGQGIRAW
jgi:hypothetical protein